ncbi:MAG: class I SAM-dependent methyltransferase [Planctomycetota bacterium]|nr:class I SAM-dependent methyltransferase [Planctomycetota bacterium]
MTRDGGRREISGETPDDPYSRLDYRRLIAWPRRIRREAPFLRRVLDGAPETSVVDLGCGSGEHCRFLVQEGFRATGLDSSESMLALAREKPLPEGLRFVRGDIQRADEALGERFGAALCLGNTLVHITDDEDLRAAFAAVSRSLLPGGRFLLQILNYERIRRHDIRHLPLNFVKEESGEIIFLRLMETLDGGRVRFCPTTLRYDPSAEPPLEVLRSRLVELRGWRREELTPRLEGAGFDVIDVHGDMEGGPFDPDGSQDLLVVARRRD